jgi:hypothetical protein
MRGSTTLNSQLSQTPRNNQIAITFAAFDNELKSEFIRRPASPIASRLNVRGDRMRFAAMTDL